MNNGRQTRVHPRSVVLDVRDFLVGERDDEVRERYRVAERRAATERLVECGAEAPYVRSSVDTLGVRQLLGGHVQRGT